MSALWTLTARELRGLRAYAVMLFVFFCASQVLWYLLTEHIDDLALTSILTSEPTAYYLIFVLAFGLGTAMPASEHDRGTIAFLETLPLTRHHVYAAKLIAGLAVLLVAPLASFVWTTPALALSRTSVDDSLHLALNAAHHACFYACAAVAFAYGLALSPLRRLAWAAVAVVIVLVERFTVDWPWLDSFRPAALLPAREGLRALAPVAALSLQLPLAAAAVVVGWLGFAVSGDRLATWFVSLPHSRRGRAFLVVTGLGVVASWIGVIAVLQDDDSGGRAGGGGGGDESYAPAGTSFTRPPALRVNHGVIELRVRGGLSPEAQRRLQELPAIHGRVRARFDNAEAPVISIDATRPLGIASHLGQASWQTIAVDSDVLERDVLEDVLAHELTHVYANVVSERGLSEHAATMRAFNEGLACVVAEDVAGAANPWQLAVAFARHRRVVESDMLFSDDRLRTVLDPALAYGLGRELVRATVDVGGPEAPLRVLRAMTDAPKDVSGTTLARDLYQRAGMNLDAVLRRWWARLDDAVRAERERLATLPRTFAGVSVDDENVIVTLSFKAWPPGAYPVCQARPETFAAPERYLTRNAHRSDGDDEANETFECVFSRRRLPGESADVQVGWTFDDVTVYEPWSQVSLRD